MRIDRINLSGSLSISSSLAVTPLRVNDNYLFISSTGNVGIGTSSPTKKLVVTGSVSVQGQLKATTLSGSFTGSIKLPTIPLGTSETNIVLVDGSGGLVYRSNLSLTGAQGNQGATGVQGTNGTVGTQGFQGNQGATGTNAGITSYTNPANNRILTAVSSTEINAESNLTFDGSILDVNTTAALKVPVGTTAERPVSPTTGSMRYNTTTSALEIHLGGRWQQVSVSDYTVTVDYLVVAGGGGGGGGASGAGGGGGAGGYRTDTGLSVNKNTPITITVGSLGSGGTFSTFGTKGGNSQFSTIIATVGGRGGYVSPAQSAGNGGSGGGGGGNGTSTFGNGNEGNFTPIEGNNGGSNNLTISNWGAGGGGGANTVGSNGEANNPGNGGSGLTSSLNSLVYSGGGGGGSWNAGTSNGLGGSSIGGNGGKGSLSNGVNASPNNRGSGGGGGGQDSAGGNGSAGVVIIKILSSINATFSIGVSQTSITSGGFTTITVTAAGVSDTVTFS